MTINNIINEKLLSPLQPNNNFGILVIFENWSYLIDCLFYVIVKIFQFPVVIIGYMNLQSWNL